MAERKPISKKMRFEVFKRDRFTCQYCGRMSPDVILEIDHIEPVSKGGTNNMLNLITSCRDCNRGKGKTRISDDSKVKKQQEQLKELAEKQEQVKMMIEWQKSLHELEDLQVDAIEQIIINLTGFGLSECSRVIIKKDIREFTFQEVSIATEISINNYYAPFDEQSLAYSIRKIGGICYNRKNQQKG